MVTESNCLTHDSPHQRGQNCAAWVRTYDTAPWTDGPYSYKEMPEDYGDCVWRPDRWHEPHEGITGAERDDDLLDLTPEALRRRLIMCAMAKGFHDAVGVGNAAPRVQRMNERFNRPFTGPHNFRPGDLMIETSALYGAPSRDGWERGFGIYITDRQEWATTLGEYEEWIEEERTYYEDTTYDFDPKSPDWARHTDHAWYIQYGSNPGDVCRWTNCSFLAVPTSYAMLAELERPAGVRTENGILITRDSLLGSLADSGFVLDAS